MSAFSFTAPHITKEQEKEEYSNFDEEERADIQRDLYGTDTPTTFAEDERPEILPESMTLLQEALEAIPQHEKVDYLQALERVPHLVARESPGESFLRAMQFDPWAAASRLVAYWKFRREAFGTERAFEPMTLDGAMKQDKHIFELGFCALLPPDRAGRCVVFWNRIACTRAVAPRESFVSTTTRRPEETWRSRQELTTTRTLAPADLMPSTSASTGIGRPLMTILRPSKAKRRPSQVVGLC